MVELKSSRGDDGSKMPPSFNDVQHENYLGKPAVVERLIAEAAERHHQLILARGAGALTSEQFSKIVNDRALEFSRILSGQHPDYLGIKGWNSPDHGLAVYLKFDLSTYWIAHHAKHKDDPYQVLYAYILWAVFDALTRSKNDEAGVLFQVFLGPTLRKLVELILGIGKRH